MSSPTFPPVSRRWFLKGASLGVGIPVIGSLLTACGESSSQATSASTNTPPDMTAMPQGQAGGMTADEMDAMHEAGIKAFVAGVKTEGLGNQSLAPRVENGIKIFELTIQKIQWEVTPGTKVDAIAYNGQVPGPEIRVTEGDTVRV